MKSPDAEARQLARILLDAQVDGMVPARTVRACRVLPPSACKISHFTLHEAARWLDIPAAIFEQEHARWFTVNRIVGGAGCAGVGPVGPAGSRRPRGGGSLTRSKPR